MEDRLIPLNAALDLATPHGVNRSVLADSGYQIAGLEVPCITPHGTVVIDIVLAHSQTGHLIARESKSGGNVEVEQARRYQALEARTVVSGAFVTLRERVPPKLEVLYVARGESADRIMYGLNQADAAAAVLAVHPDKITLENAEYASSELQGLLSDPVQLSGPPARHIPFDQDSGLDEVQPHVAAALIAALARRAPMISLGTLTERLR